MLLIFLNLLGSKHNLANCLSNPVLLARVLVETVPFYLIKFSHACNKHRTTLISSQVKVSDGKQTHPQQISCYTTCFFSLKKLKTKKITFFFYIFFNLFDPTTKNWNEPRRWKNGCVDNTTLYISEQFIVVPKFYIHIVIKFITNMS